MLTSTGTYKQAITAPHAIAVRVDLETLDGDVLERDVEVFGGSVSARLTRRVTRTGSFTVGPEFWPTSATSALTPYQTVARISAGIRYGDGSEERFPVLTGRVAEVTRNPDGDVSATVDDLAADVVGLRFEEPYSSQSPTILAQIERLIRDVLPNAVFGAHDVVDAPTPKLTWDEDRGKALDDLAEALGGRWYALGDGSFVVRRLPYDVGTPVAHLSDGEEGLLVTGTPSLSRRDAANSVTVVVERFDGGTPFRVTARDNSPTSPTRYDGPFGRVSQVIKVQTPLTIGQATTYARSQLNASTALASTWQAACIPDYTLEPGDTVRLTSRGVSEIQLIDAITYPLGPGTMSMSTRAYVRAQATLE